MIYEGARISARLLIEDLAKEKAPAILADLPTTSPLATQGDPS